MIKKLLLSIALTLLVTLNCFAIALNQYGHITDDIHQENLKYSTENGIYTIRCDGHAFEGNSFSALHQVISHLLPLRIMFRQYSIFMITMGNSSLRIPIIKSLIFLFLIMENMLHFLMEKRLLFSNLKRLLFNSIPGLLFLPLIILVILLATMPKKVL